MFDPTLKEGETELAYLWRLGNAHENGLTTLSWDAIADLVNRAFREDTPYKECAYRKTYSAAKKFCDAGVLYAGGEPGLEETKREIMKERQKLFDERRAMRTSVRNEARNDYDMAYLAEKLTQIGAARYPYEHTSHVVAGHKDMVVMLSDLHIGATFDSFTGSYDSEIARARMAQYCQKAIELAKANAVETVYIVGLADYINGNIHLSVQVTNRENVIDQIKIACELITEFVYKLSCEVNNVRVYGVSGNHSRLAKKSDALTDERLDALVLWYVKHMLAGCGNVAVCDENIDSTVCLFRIYDKLYVGVHGDYDGMDSGKIKSLCMWLGEIPYCVMMGHKHFNAMTEVNGVKVVQSGSLCGSGDNFTREQRLSGSAQQMILITNDGEIENIYPVVL